MPRSSSYRENTVQTLLVYLVRLGNHLNYEIESRVSKRNTNIDPSTPAVINAPKLYQGWAIKSIIILHYITFFRSHMLWSLNYVNFYCFIFCIVNTKRVQQCICFCLYPTNSTYLWGLLPYDTCIIYLQTCSHYWVYSVKIFYHRFLFEKVIQVVMLTKNSHC